MELKNNAVDGYEKCSEERCMEERCMIGQKLILTFAIGLLATLVMTVLMLLGTLMDLSPMPNPVPAAIVGKVFGQSIPQTSRMLLGFVGHFVYGGIWAILLWHLARPVTIFKGISLGIILWMIMQLGVLPFLGWGVFGSAVTSKIAIATFLLHILYGGVLGLLGQFMSTGTPGRLFAQYDSG